VRSLSQVKTVYVEPLSGITGVKQLHESLVKRLEKSGPFQVVDSAAQADAVMKGSGGLWVRGYSAINMRDPASNRVPIYGGYISVQLAAKDGEPLWSYLVTPSNMGWKNVVDDMTATLVKELAAAREAPSTPVAATKGGSAEGAVLAGAGATFPQPLYQQWFDTLRQLRNITISYSAVGSQEGMRLLADKKVDFAASEVDPSEDYELTKTAGSFLRVPSVLGGVVPAYNLPDIHEDLRFTAELLADIYLGKITKWNDKRIAKLNGGVPLPDARIVVVHRADGSGTTYAWSSFLARASAEWKTNVGAGMLLAWPAGVGADGNVGVAATVKRTVNSIGYIEMVYAIEGQIEYGAVQNRAGQFVRADLESLSVAANSIGIDPGSASGSLDPADKRGYPIATFTWLLVPREIEDGIKKAALGELLRWALTSGQKACSALGYAPLPRDLAERELELVGRWK
jgi:phosphate ABC transporter phosphate-binding protein